MELAQEQGCKRRAQAEPSRMRPRTRRVRGEPCPVTARGSALRGRVCGCSTRCGSRLAFSRRGAASRLSAGDWR
ncbi:MAG: hypothetical protein ACLTMP_12905 [Eggerthella lenta]